jgi:putative molybdopterin biosynthesis protein
MSGERSDEKYLTTKEVARHLRLNEKKVYALVAAGQLPAARVSGKWLFPRRLIDEWVEKNTIHPASGLLGALLDELIVMQGSDDPLLSRLLEEVQEAVGRPIPAAAVGSMGGLEALRLGRAHLAGAHVDKKAIEGALRDGGSWYVVDLFERTQGLMFDKDACPRLAEGLSAAGGLRMAGRQPSSGTYRLSRRLLEQAGVDPASIEAGLRCSMHLEVALAVMQRRADFGIGIEAAAEACRLGFTPLHQERFQMVLRGEHLSHPSMQRLLDALLSGLREVAVEAPAGYAFGCTGRLAPMSREAPEGGG